MTLNINASHCPLCQQKNLCNVTSPQGCWCTKKKVPTKLIQQVPEEAKGKRCICQACVDKFNLAEENNFIAL
jgi:hypothetical protein